MSWYREHRPQTVSALHLPLVRERLQTMLKSGTLTHALLFAGTRGTGKTSAARILAKALNCEQNKHSVTQFLQNKKPESFVEPCGKCPSCLAILNNSAFSVVEIDGATYRKIDDVRALQDRAMLAPSDGIVTVFIIDEVHMLTTEAFNALLKLIEEPPAHVVFVLATTELQKVPKTIQSRCELVVFDRAAENVIAQVVRDVAALHAVTLADGVDALIARDADGSFRDAIKILEQMARSQTSISLEYAQSSLRIPPRTILEHLIQQLFKRDVAGLQETFSEIHTKQMDLKSIQTAVLEMVYEKFTQSEKGKRELLSLLQTVSVPADPLLPDPFLPFELACYEWCLQGEKMGEKTEVIRDANMTKKADESKPPAYSKPQPPLQQHLKQQQQQESPAEESPKKTQTNGQTNLTITLEEMKQKWPVLLAASKKKNASVEGLLRAAEPMKLENGELHITVYYPFHKDQLEVTKNRTILEQAATDLFGGKINVYCHLGKKTSVPAQQKKVPSAEEIELEKSVEDALINN